MKRPVAPSVLGLALAIMVGGQAAARLVDRDLRWCPVEPAHSAASVRTRLGLGALSAKPQAVHHRVALATPAPHRSPRVLVRFEQPYAPAAGVEQVSSSCTGNHVSILCPGYQLVGAEY